MWLTLIVAETISASSGLGYMAMQAREFMLVDVVVLAILIYALLGKAADSATRLLERASSRLESRLSQRLRTSSCEPRRYPVSRRVSFDPVSGIPEVSWLERTAAAPEARTPPTERQPGLSIALEKVGKTFGGNRVLEGSICASAPARSSRSSARAVVARARCCACSSASTSRPRAGSARRTAAEARGADPPHHVPGAAASALGARDRQCRGRARRRPNPLEAACARARGARAGRPLEKARDWPATLSGGQRQRVALARALVSRPSSALDEPLGALDALTRIDMQGFIERIWLGQGFTAVLVTHDVSEAVALADRILVIEDGRIALDLPVDVPRPRHRGDARPRGPRGADLRPSLPRTDAVPPVRGVAGPA